MAHLDPEKSFFGELRHGWRNLAAATIGIGLGTSNYTPLSSLFFRALEAEFHWSKGAAAAALVAMPLTAIAVPLAGALIDRFGLRPITALSVLCTAASYSFLSRMSGSLGGFYAGFLVLNLLGCATGAVGYTRLVVADFTASRGTALAIALVGIAGSALLLPPWIGGIIHQAGWRSGYAMMVALTLAGGGFALAIMQPRARPAGAAPDADVPGVRVRDAIASRGFWLLGLAMLCISVATLGLVSQFQSVFVEKGLSEAGAAWTISLLAVSVVTSRLVIGRLLDLPGPTRWAALAMLIAAAGALLLLPAHVPPALVALAVILIGCSAGAELDLMAFFASRLFGLRHYSAIYGALFAFHYCGIAIGGIGYGLLHDRLGSYAGGLGASAALLTIAALLFVALGRTTQEERRT